MKQLETNRIRESSLFELNTITITTIDYDQYKRVYRNTFSSHTVAANSKKTWKFYINRFIIFIHMKERKILDFYSRI